MPHRRARLGRTRAELTIGGSLPIAAGEALALKLRGTLDAALANSLLSAGGQRLAGARRPRCRGDRHAGGPPGRGRCYPDGRAFTDPLQGIRLTNIEGRVTGAATPWWWSA